MDATVPSVRIGGWPWVLAGSLLLACACSGSSDTPPAALEEEPTELTREECAHLLEIEPTGVRQEEVIAPSAVELAADTLDPAGADLSKYGVVLAVEQTITNLLDRKVVVESGGATLSPAGTEEVHEAEYTFEEPLELGPHESRSVEMRVRILANEASPAYALGIVDGSFADARVAPFVRVTIPASDNCGYPEGILVRAKEGTLEVRRPAQDDALTGILSGILKAFGHA